MTDINLENLLENAMFIARKMVESGAEVRRAEETVSRICRSYGVIKCEVYALTSVIVATIKAPDKKSYTSSERIEYVNNDLQMLEKWNGVSRKICEEIPSLEEMNSYIENIGESNRSIILDIIGYFLAAFNFTLFFGGNLFDAFSSGLISFVVLLCNKRLRVKSINNIIFTVTACFLSGISCLILVRLGIGNNIDKIMIGVIMLFIPSLAMVNGIREMFDRDIMGGLFRFLEAIIIAGSIAIGFGLAITLLGGYIK